MHKKYSEENLKKVLELLEYIPRLGVVRWKVSVSGRAEAGSRAGCKGSHGYRFITVAGTIFPEHRIVWALCNGFWPRKAHMDHINGVKDDNRIENLREAHAYENSQNISALRKKSDKAKSKYIGVTYQLAPNGTVLSKPWKSQMHHQRKMVYIGYFATELEAHEAYLATKAKLHTFSPVLRDIDDV